MEINSNLLGGVNSENTFKRIEYKYSEIKAKHAWKAIASKLINDEIKIDNDNKKAWSELIKYVFADKNCEYDINKGIGLIGRTGSGKTKTMEIINEFILIDDIKFFREGKIARFKFNIVSSKIMAGDYQTKGYSTIFKYSNMCNLCIDDLGSENITTKHYGDEINVIEEIIENRYSKNLITHFTSNLNTDLILQMYGDRVYSRLIHSSNIIELNVTDYRISIK